MYCIHFTVYCLWFSSVLYCIIVIVIILSSFLLCFFFFFKQKTAYEMRISDWSSDVCSSDLLGLRWLPKRFELIDIDSFRVAATWFRRGRDLIIAVAAGQIGRASCRERVCQYV